MTKVTKNRTFVILSLVLLLVTGLMVILSRQFGITFFEDITASALVPAKRLVFTVTTNIDREIANIVNLFDAVDENEVLKVRLAEAEAQLTVMSEIKSENDRLEQLLNFTQREEKEIVAGGRVIGKQPGIWFETFTIDVGTNQGVDKNMAVINHYGLLGRIVDVGETWAKVLSVVDERSAVSAIIERTRYNGIVRGDYLADEDLGLCRMIYLPIEADITIGDRVLTSGLDGIFPKGILIGTVTQVVGREHELFVSSVVDPAVDFLRIEEVLVVKAPQ